jgi:hypothetical protein
MAELRDDRSEARSEAAALLGVDINHLSPADGLRVDMVSALRLVIDEQATILSGGAADLGKLNVAVQSLIALLPGRELPAPSESHPDPRLEMWRIYSEMRSRGEINLRKDGETDEGLQSKITQLESENAQLRAALGGSSAITPPLSDIVPPSERAECDAGPIAGPDDRPRRSPVTIEGKANPPPAAPRNWDETDNGRKWQAWVDAGGAHYDRWSNRNGA